MLYIISRHLQHNLFTFATFIMYVSWSSLKSILFRACAIFFNCLRCTISSWHFDNGSRFTVLGVHHTILTSSLTPKVNTTRCQVEDWLVREWWHRSIACYWLKITNTYFLRSLNKQTNNKTTSRQTVKKQANERASQSASQQTTNKKHVLYHQLHFLYLRLAPLVIRNDQSHCHHLKYKPLSITFKKVYTFFFHKLIKILDHDSFMF